MSKKCNNNSGGGHFLWLTKSCFPNSNHHHHHPSALVHHPIIISTTTLSLSISAVPDDLLLDILSRLPHSSFSSISLVCRRWSNLLHSTAFHHLRRLHNRLSLAVFVVSLHPFTFFSSAHHRLVPNFPWATLIITPALEFNPRAFPPECFSHARLVSLGPKIYVISRSAMFSYNTWSSVVLMEPGMISARKKFAAAAVNGKIYISGGACRSNALEEYDPSTGKWVVVGSALRKRYGCIGASVAGIFYVIGGLKIGACASQSGAEANAYPSSMDLYDVEAREWLKSQAVPGGGCIVAACGAGDYLYVLTSHAVELSFWRFNGCRSSKEYKVWRRIAAPPMPAQVRVDSTVRFSCIGIGEKVMLIQVMGCIDDLLRRSGRIARGLKEGLVLVFDSTTEEWSRAADLPENITRAAAVCVEC